MCKCCEGEETKQNNRQRKYSHTSLTPEFAEASAKGLECRFERDLAPEKTKPVGPHQLASEDGLLGGDGGLAGLGEFGLGVEDGDAAGGSWPIKSCQQLRKGGMKRTG
jgi:hypothetical protein